MIRTWVCHTTAKERDTENEEEIISSEDILQQTWRFRAMTECHYLFSKLGFRKDLRLCVCPVTHTDAQRKEMSFSGLLWLDIVKHDRKTSQDMYFLKQAEAKVDGNECEKLQMFEESQRMLNASEE